MSLVAPFPYFGGKRRISHVIWERFGNVRNYVEPFFGSGAVLLGRPSNPQIETVNDKCGFISNFWRAIQNDPDQTAHHAAWPVNETDLHARHAFLVREAENLEKRLLADPEFFDPKIAGWWCWGASCWIAGGWCSGVGPWQVVGGELVKTSKPGVERKRPELDHEKGMRSETGTMRPKPYLSGVVPVEIETDSPGVTMKRISLGGNGGFQGVVSAGYNALEQFRALAERLRRVRVCSGDWARVCTPAVTHKIGLTGVFFDPPYSHDLRDGRLYRHESASVAEEVRFWCQVNGNRKDLRIALCGLGEEHDALLDNGWTKFSWETTGGYGNRAQKRGRENAKQERIWFSPACLDGSQKTIFELFESESGHDKEGI